MVPLIDEVLLEYVSIGALVVALALSVVVLRHGEDRRLLEPIRERFVLGVPWGTVLIILGLYAVYFLAQGGDQSGGPIVAGFRSWSIWYPQGIVFSSFAHASDSHITGNVLGTVAFAPIVEYAWSHYPRERGSQSFSSWRTNPFARIGLFVVGVIVAGLLDSLFVPGAIIGFSGVVFVFAGFAVVTAPIVTVAAMLGIQVVNAVRLAFLYPVVTAVARPRFVTPSWAGIALQGHAFGFLVGALLAVWLLRSRSQVPSLRYVWFAALAFAVSRSMHSLYWFLGSDRFELFRGLGTAGVFLLASLIALSLLSPDRPLVPRVDLSAREAAVGLLLAFVLAISLAAVPYNLVSVSPGEELDDGLEVEDYTVTYVENTENRYISSVRIPVIGSPLSADVSGVVVASDRRSLWAVPVTRGELAFDGRAVVPVGDATWREEVVINRTTWAVLGGNETYKVYGRHDDNPRQQLFTAEPAQVSGRIADNRIRIQPSEEFYDIVVEQNDTAIGVAQVPAHNESVTLAGVTFERENRDLYARHDGTRIRIAEFRLRQRELR